MSLKRMLVFILLLSYSVLASSRPTMLFSCAVPESQPQWVVTMAVYTEAFDKLDYDFSMVYVNPTRERSEHKYSQSYDGACARGGDFADEFDINSIVKIDAVIAKTIISVWRRADVVAEPSDALFFAGAKVGYVRGTMHADSIFLEHADVVPVSFLKPIMGLKTLAAGRIDYWLGIAVAGSAIVQHFDLQSLVVKTADVGSVNLYPFLNKKHSSIAEQLQVELKSIMERRGSLIE